MVIITMTFNSVCLEQNVETAGLRVERGNSQLKKVCDINTCIMYDEFCYRLLS